MSRRMLILGAMFAGAGCGFQDELVGTWACQSMNMGTYTGRPCRLEPWLHLNAGGTYEWSSEKGTWEYKSKTLMLSKRAGAGHLNNDGKLVFEYDLNGKHYVLTLDRRQQ